jgi:hypothetical protein
LDYLRQNLPPQLFWSAKNVQQAAGNPITTNSAVSYRILGQVVLKQINNTSDCEQGMALFATLLENINYVVRLQHMLPLGKHAKPVLGRNADVFGWLAATVEYCQVAKQRKLAAQSPARLLMGVCKMIILSYENYETEFKFRSSHLAPLVIQILHQYCRPEEYIVSAIMIYELYSLLTGHLG